jgi:hypothetical protein
MPKGGLFLQNKWALFVELEKKENSIVGIMFSEKRAD